MGCCASKPHEEPLLVSGLLSIHFHWLLITNANGWSCTAAEAPTGCQHHGCSCLGWQAHARRLQGGLIAAVPQTWHPHRLLTEPRRTFCPAAVAFCSQLPSLLPLQGIHPCGGAGHPCVRSTVHRRGGTPGGRTLHQQLLRGLHQGAAAGGARQGPTPDCAAAGGILLCTAEPVRPGTAAKLVKATT